MAYGSATKKVATCIGGKRTFLPIRHIFAKEFVAWMADKKPELFGYEAPWNIYAMAWSQRKDKPFRLAVGSFIEEYKNKARLFFVNYRCNVGVSAQSC